MDEYVFDVPWSESRLGIAQPTGAFDSSHSLGAAGSLVSQIAREFDKELSLLLRNIAAILLSLSGHIETQRTA